MEIFLILLGWFLIGTTGFVFWWTKQHDFTFNDIPQACFIGLIGPLSWIIGAFLHCDPDRKIVIVRKRNTKNE